MPNIRCGTTPWPSRCRPGPYQIQRQPGNAVNTLRGHLHPRIVGCVVSAHLKMAGCVRLGRPYNTGSFLAPGEVEVPLRFVLALLVFAASFGIGVGGTYLLIRGVSADAPASGADPEQAPETFRRPAEGSAPAGSVLATENSGDPEGGDAPTGETAEAQAGRDTEPALDGPGGALAAYPPVEADSAAGNAVGEGGGESQEAEAGAEGGPSAPAGDRPTEGGAESPENAGEPDSWWLGIRGTSCELGLAEVDFRSLSLRAGAFEHNRLVDWDDDFGDAKRLGVFRAEDSPRVEVLAIGFDRRGMPTAAHVKDESTGKTGVVALQTEGKLIPLRPVGVDPSGAP